MLLEYICPAPNDRVLGICETEEQLPIKPTDFVAHATGCLPLRFLAESFDKAVVTGGLENDRQFELLAELNRVLVTRGVLVLATYLEGRGARMENLQRELAATGFELIAAQSLWDERILIKAIKVRRCGHYIVPTNGK
ncbi:MAG: hypothetical protein H5T69_04560 [Chloroflexi bacterium]|nr:hypothetical protein [Chloroflexota bacterium]